MLEFLTIVLMLATAAWFANVGVFFAAVMWLSVWLAGLFAFCCFEPLASSLERLLGPFADAVALVGLFCLGMVALRWARQGLVRQDIEFPIWVERSGGAIFGLLIGYSLAGLIFCVWQTLPVQERFLGYDLQHGVGLGGPERMWLAAMHRASRETLARADPAQEESYVFDPDASFVWRYARYRRIAPGKTAPAVAREEFPFGPVYRPRSED